MCCSTSSNSVPRRRGHSTLTSHPPRASPSSPSSPFFFKARLVEESLAFFNGNAPNVVVFAAGVGRFGNVAAASISDFDLQFKTNVRGVFLWIRLVVPRMVASGGGQIVSINSVAGVWQLPGEGLYCATKHALRAMMTCLRGEMKAGRTGVKVGSIRPGAIATPWWTEAARGGRVVSDSALPKMLAPAAVADACMAIVNQAPSSDIESILIEPVRGMETIDASEWR